MPIIPPLRRLRQKVYLQVQGQPGIHSKTLSQNNSNKKERSKEELNGWTGADPYSSEPRDCQMKE